MDDISVKQLIIDLLIIPKGWTEEIYNSKSRELDNYFDSFKILDEIEITDDDFNNLEKSPTVDNPIVEKILNTLQQFNTKIIKKNFSNHQKLNSIELLNLFKRGFNPYNLISNQEFENIRKEFNSYFKINNFFEILFDRFNHDEIYEDPDEFDSEILDLINKNIKEY